ncbi:MAG: hypothetical protein HY915_04465 [Desulfovibrio sp.]|nr:hypothetical protein [Desulfovibrio sp.]
MAVAAQALGRPESDFTVKDGAVYLNSERGPVRVGGLGGMTPQESLSNLGKEALATTASNPVSTAGNAALAFSSPEFIASPWVQGALGAGDEFARRMVGNYIMPDMYGTRQRPWSMPDTVAVPANGLLSGLFAGVVNKTFGGGNPILKNLTPGEVAAGAENLAKTPIPLSLGQATRNPALLDAEGRLRMFPGALDIAKRQSEAQNLAARDAVEGFAGGMASSTDPAMLGKNIVDAASNTLQELKNFRARAAGPLYEMARLPSDTPLDASGIVQAIDTKLAGQGTPEAVKSLLEKAKAQLFSNGELRNTPEGLQAAKQGIDSLIEGLGENENQARSALMGVKTELMDYMTRNISGFKTANDVFAAHSGPIQSFWDSILNKVRNLTPDNASKAPGMLFNPNAGMPNTPAMVTGWKDQIAGQFPQSWQDAMAARILQASQGFKTSANGGLGNYSGQVGKELGGSQAAMDMWQAGMSPEQYSALKNLVDGLNLASQGSRGQSWTFAGKPSIEALQGASMGPVEGGISKALELGTVVSPGSWAGMFQDWRFKKNAPKLAELLFNPPADWQNMLPPDVRPYQLAALLPRIMAAQGFGGIIEGGQK